MVFIVTAAPDWRLFTEREETQQKWQTKDFVTCQGGPPPELAQQTTLLGESIAFHQVQFQAKAAAQLCNLFINTILCHAQLQCYSYWRYISTGTEFHNERLLFVKNIWKIYENFWGFGLGALHCLQHASCKIIRIQGYRWLGMVCVRNELIIKSDSGGLKIKSKNDWFYRNSFIPENHLASKQRHYFILKTCFKCQKKNKKISHTRR